MVLEGGSVPRAEQSLAEGGSWAVSSLRASQGNSPLLAGQHPEQQEDMRMGEIHQDCLCDWQKTGVKWPQQGPPHMIIMLIRFSCRADNVATVKS